MISATLFARPGHAAAQLSVPASQPVESSSAQALWVQREPGAELCADADALLARIEQLRGRPDAGASAGYRVVFARGADGFTATIAAGADPARTRELRDQGATCAALEHATALSLALLLDSDARESTQRAAERERAAQAPPPAIKPRAAIARPAGTQLDPAPDPGDGEADAVDAAQRRMALRAQLSLGLGGAFGVLRPLAPAFSLELGLGAGRLRGALSGLFVPTQTHEFGAGSVAETLWAGAARACVAPWLGSSLRLDGCSGLYAGALHARAEGFTRNDGATRLWLALPIELALSSTWLPAGWELSAALLWPLQRDDFSIAGAGTAYPSPKLAALVTLRGYLAWSW
ncbi:MAG TPA: hypothetical protein VK509_17005 [Polyangiales bacterium]|nr:hypothetical protein [Polyangiales bacterium]